MARPKSDKPKLTKIVSARLTDEQNEDFLKRLKLSGLKESEYIRRAILGDETTIIAAPVQSETDRRQLFVISKASNNLNQLAHVMNTARLQGAIDRELCIDLLAKLDRISRYLKASL